MPLIRVASRLVAGSFLAVLILETGASPARPETPAAPPAASPWGVSASASSSRDRAEWFPRMAAAGVSSVRLFPEWRGFEPEKGTWKWDDGDALVRDAADNGLEIDAVLMGSPPGAQGVHAFPMDDLGGWSDYVSAVVGRYKKRIHYWEIWNEGNGGFNDGHHTTADYARLAASAYRAAKKADPQAQVGLTVASFDAPYLDQTFRAMAKAGEPNSFDYLCVHPYEIADGLSEPDGEVPFLWMTRLLRDALRADAPERAGAEIWITEVGRRLGKHDGRVVSEADAAATLVKVYVMAIAQGVARTEWFEARDPAGEDQGFGLLGRDGRPRASYQALKNLTALLGPTPKYLGWLAPGRHGRGYGFVFEGKSGPVLVAWMPAGLTDRTFTFAGDVGLTDPLSGAATRLEAGRPLTLTEAPVLVTGLPPDLPKQAAANAGKNFPWGGDYSSARTVRFRPGFPDVIEGVFPIGRAGAPTVRFADGSTGVLVQGDINHPLTFYAHPSFAAFGTRGYYVRASVRRVAAGNAGMNLIYEAADGQGRTPYKNAGQWFGVTDGNGWQTHTWHITDACFAKMWGYDFIIRPEQSVPFVVGDVEVSTAPF